MTDSCNAIKIINNSEINKDINKHFNEYVTKYCNKHNCTIAQALTHKIVIETYNNFIESGKDKK